jgi:hypothetical protein
MDDVLREFEETALLGCRAVREFLIYSGENKSYQSRAKAGAVAMGSYARLRATLANERQLVILERKLSDGADDSVQQLREGNAVSVPMLRSETQV